MFPAYPTTKFSSNYGGRLLVQNFSDVRDLNDKFKVGSLHEIEYRGKSIGIAEVVAIRKFYFKDIRDSLSYLICGKPAYYLAAMVSKYYNSGIPLQPDHVLLHVGYSWKKRNLELHQSLLQEWWNDVIETQVA